MKLLPEVVNRLLIQVKFNSFKYSYKKCSKQPGKFRGQLDLLSFDLNEVRCNLIHIKSTIHQKWMKFCPEVVERLLFKTKFISPAKLQEEKLETSCFGAWKQLA